MRHGYREITRRSKHSLFKTQLLKWECAHGAGAGLDLRASAGISHRSCGSGAAHGRDPG
jgi:hypothetical protein